MATSIGYIIPFFVSAAYYVGKKSRSVFKLRFKGFSPKLCMEMLRLGAPMGVIKGSISISGLVINNLLTSFNMPFLVAANGVFSQITVFVRAAWNAPADTLMAFAGIFAGEEDSKPLNLNDYYQLIKANYEKDKEISLAIIFKMAKQVKYTSTFGANNLIIRV